MKREALLCFKALVIDIFMLDYTNTWFNRKLHFNDIIVRSPDVRSSGVSTFAQLYREA